MIKDQKISYKYYFPFLIVGVIFISAFLGMQTASAQYGSTCSQEYGFMAYEDYNGYCKCMSGYVFQDDYFGTRCVSANSVCQDDYGIMTRYDSVSKSCECSYGYVFGEDILGRTQCISDDKACKNQLGYNSRATYGGQCECSYGYVIDGGQCVDGDRVCRADHGTYASYDSLSKSCECDDGYTLDDDYQCVKKHNSAYFTLLDINENGDELLVQSQYDFQNYILEFGYGCWDFAIESYKGLNLVINMGTDFSVDFYDTIVLQNHDQTCSITNIDWTYNDSFPTSEAEDFNEYYVTPSYTYPPPSNIGNHQSVEAAGVEATGSKSEDYEVSAGTENIDIATDDSTSTIVQTDKKTIEAEKPASFVGKIISFFKNLFK